MSQPPNPEQHWHSVPFPHNHGYRGYVDLRSKDESSNAISYPSLPSRIVPRPESPEGNSGKTEPKRDVDDISKPSPPHRSAKTSCKLDQVSLGRSKCHVPPRPWEPPLRRFTKSGTIGRSLKRRSKSAVNTRHPLLGSCPPTAGFCASLSSRQAVEATKPGFRAATRSGSVPRDTGPCARSPLRQTARPDRWAEGLETPCGYRT